MAVPYRRKNGRKKKKREEKQMKMEKEKNKKLQREKISSRDDLAQRKVENVKEKKE